MSSLHAYVSELFYVIHGGKPCDSCDILDVADRRDVLAMRLLNEFRNDSNHILYELVPKTSVRSNRIILPHVRTTRRMNSFFFACSVTHNDQLASVHV